MAKITSFADSAKGLTFLDDNKNVVETIAYAKPVEAGDAMFAVNREFTQRASVASATVSLMLLLLQHGKCAGYEVKIGAPIPSAMLESLRDSENDILSPLYKAAYLAKGGKPEKAEEKWQMLRADLRKGGSYAQGKGKILKYYAYTGKLPCAYNADGTPDTGRQLTVAAVEKLLGLLAKKAEKADNSIAARIVALLAEAGEKNAVMYSNECGADTAIAALDKLRDLLKPVIQKLPADAASVKDIADKVIGKAAKEVAAV